MVARGWRAGRERGERGMAATGNFFFFQGDENILDLVVMVA